MSVDILRISELRWTGMGEFNSDDHYIYYCGQESLRRNGVALKINKRIPNANSFEFAYNLKNDRMISVRFHGKSFNITVIQVYGPTINAKLKLNSSIKTYKTFRTNTQKRCPFHYRRLECKSMKSRDIGITSKSGLGVQNKAGQRLTRVFERAYIHHSKYPFPTTTQEKTLHMDITRWSILKSD